MKLSLFTGLVKPSPVARTVFSLTTAFLFSFSALSPQAAAQNRQPSGLASVVPAHAGAVSSVSPKFTGEDSGSLAVINPKTGKPGGKCPLKHTSVSAQVSGYVTRVTVKQLFENPFKEKIEAVYTFPLSETGAVDDMLMKVGSRTIHGTIKRREEARKIYEAAKTRGQVASLLDQERPNIFTQSVANIKPGERVEITLQYVDLLPYEDGSFTFAFPTVVGPRFNPGTPTGKAGTGWSADGDAVPDGSKITPPVTPKGTRSGHDISIEVSIDAGVPIRTISSKLHDVTTNRAAGDRAVIALKDKETIPNKDFVLSWDVAGDQLQSGYLAHRNEQSGYFTIMLLPPKRVTPDTVAPKEMVFLIDCSGSQSGAPLQKAKETMNYILDHMNPNDTFQVISFSNDLKVLFDSPEPANSSMREKARHFIESLSANGGTWMAPAVERACSILADAHRLRIVTFMTDGYVGNDFEIIGMVRKLRGNSRWFPFGTGNSVNRMLVDGMAREGGGEAEYVLLNSPGNEVGKKFYERISSPVLTDVKVDFQGVEVKEVFPHQVSDVWAQRPLYIKGRYNKPGKGTVTLSGFAGGRPYTQKLPIVLPDKETANQAISSIWARAKVDRLISEDYFGAQRGAVNKELKEEIIATALDHHIMTQYTSFVAVEEKVITDGGKPKTVAVPVEMPDGVSYEGVFGDEESGRVSNRMAGHSSVKGMSMARRAMPFQAAGGGGGSGGGGGYGSMAALPKPASLAPMQSYSGTANAAPPPPAEDRSLSLEPKVQRRTGVWEAESKKEKDSAKPDVARSGSNPKLASSLRDLAGKISGEGTAYTVNGIEVSHGKVTIKIWLTNTSSAILQKLKEAGLELVAEHRSQKMIVGRVEVKKLEELAKFDFVRLIEPNKTRR